MNKILKFPLLVIAIVWFIFSFPFFSQGLVPFPSDYLVSYFAPWSAYPELFTPVKNGAMPDIFGQIYPWRFFAIESWKNMTIPLWNPYSFGGTPHLANYQSAVLSPLNIGFIFFSFIDWWSFLVLLQPLLAGIFTYWYMRIIKVGKTGSLVSSLSFMFCGFITSWMAYGTLAYAVLYIPLALYSIEKYISYMQSRYLLLLSFTVPLSFFSGHFQMSLYFLIFVSAYLFYKTVSLRKISLPMYAALMFGVVMSMPQLLPSIELYLQSFRSTLFQKIEVIPWSHILTFLAPDYYGNPVTGNIWQGHYAEWNIYIGVIPIILALYSVFNIRKKYILFFALAAVITLLFAFQSPLLDLLVALKIPVISTSALSRIVVLGSFSLAVLSGFGYEMILKDISGKKFKRSIVIYIAFFVVLTIMWGVSFLAILPDAEKSAIAKSNMRLPTILFALFVGACIFLYFAKGKGVRVFSVIIILIISLDLLRFSNKWMPFEPRSLVYPEVGVTKFIEKISGYDRVFGNFGAETSVYYKLPILEGYDAVYIRRFGQFISSLDNGTLRDSARSGVDLPLAGTYLLPGANFLGVKYFVHKITDGQNVWEFPFWEYPSESIKLIFDDGKYQVLENTNAFPRAFLVGNILVEQDPQKILDVMFKKKTNLLNTAIIEKASTSKSLASGSATIISYSPQKIEIETTVPSDMKKASFLVLTDAYYPGWKAYQCGKQNPIEVEIYRADFAFRGVYVPGGNCKTTFVYDPVSFQYGVYIAIIGAAGITSMCFLMRKRRN